MCLLSSETVPTSDKVSVWNSSKGHVLGPWMGVNSLCRNTVAPKMNLLTYLKQPKEVHSYYLRYQQGQRFPCRRVSGFASPFCSTPHGKDQGAGYSIPGLAICQQEMLSITNWQILPSPRQQLRYPESRCSFYLISVLPVGAPGLRRALVTPACFSCPRRH